MNEYQKNFFIKQLDNATQSLKSIANELFRKTRPNVQLYNFAKSKLGKDIAPTQDELGCAEAINTLIREFTGEPIGGGTSTYLLYRNLKTDKRFIQTTNPQLGDIIISPSGYGNGKIRNGHIGVISNEDKVMSNNSNNGLWDEHITFELWKRKYQRVGGFPIYYYRLITK